MARIIYTGLVESIRGSIKGTTFQRNAYGYTAKAKPAMVNPNSTRQQVRKLRFSGAVQAWAELSEGQRSAWNTYANTYPIATRLNPDAYLNGFNAFSRWHVTRWVYDYGSLLTNPSGDQGILGSYQIELVRDGANLFIVSDLLPTNGPWVLISYLSRPLSATQRFVKSWSRFVGSIPANGTIDDNITSAYNALFGVTPDVGAYIGTRFVVQNTTNGQVFFLPSGVLQVIS